MVFDIVHSASLCECMHVCHPACRAAESLILACMAALTLAALLLLMQPQEPAT